jgi:uncharacterized membrane protein YdjX (TVP38/TMEM64 family)
MASNQRWWRAGTAVLLVIAGILLFKPAAALFSNANEIQLFIKSFGVLAPLAFIVLVILQVIIAPLPGQLAGLMGGYVFGTLMGTVYSLIGLLIGSAISFYIARFLGRPFVERFVKPKTTKKFDKFADKHAPLALFLIYLFPGLPDDIICYLAGITRIGIGQFLFIVLIGRLPGFLVLSFIGDSATQNGLATGIIITLSGLLALTLYIFRDAVREKSWDVIEKWKSP